MAFQIETVNSIITVSTANTNLDGTGSITGLLVANGTHGNVVETIRVQSRGAVSNGMIRLFIKEAGGSTWYMIKEIPVPSSTTSNVPLPAFATTVAANIFLANGGELGVSTQVAETFNVVGFGYEITGFVV